jgi:predicted lactoylglutathione lyase
VTNPADSTLFVTLPVADVKRSMEFFQKLGFTFNPMMTDGENAACMTINEHASFMLGSHAAFAQQSHRPMADPKTHAIALFSFSVASRDEVDRVAATAIAEGAVEADGAEDHGFMYTRSFFDLDGHGWQVMWMDPAAMAQQAAAETAGASA